jgi:hypothetical protein
MFGLQQTCPLWFLGFCPRFEQILKESLFSIEGFSPHLGCLLGQYSKGMAQNGTGMAKGGLWMNGVPGFQLDFKSETLRQLLRE